jgi:hypothetical protein
VGSELVVTVPPWPPHEATDVSIGNHAVLEQVCTQLQPDGSRLTVLDALAPGVSSLWATVTPPSRTMMPAWMGEVTVVGVASASTSTTASIPTQPPPTSSTTTTVIAAPPGTLVLTQSSAGQSFALAPGQVAQVVLPGTGQQYHGYTTPESDNLPSSPMGSRAALRPGISAPSSVA